jgi:hypothetical protein
MKHFALILGVCALAAGALPAQDGPRRGGDRDGAARAKLRAALLERFDRNDDGRLDRREIEAARRALRARMAERRDGRGRDEAPRARGPRGGDDRRLRGQDAGKRGVGRRGAPDASRPGADRGGRRGGDGIRGRGPVRPEAREELRERVRGRVRDGMQERRADAEKRPDAASRATGRGPRGPGLRRGPAR